jgi:hypothetical protein
MFLGPHRCSPSTHALSPANHATQRGALELLGHALTVTVRFPRALFDEDDFETAWEAIRLAPCGQHYTGHSQPGWYTPEALSDLLAATPKGTKLADVIGDVFGIAGAAPEPTLAGRRGSSRPTPAPETVISAKSVKPHSAYYAKVSEHAHIDGLSIPCCVEVWLDAEVAEKAEDTGFVFHPFLNRSPTLARLYYYADSMGLRVHGCGLDRKVKGPKRANYNLGVSLITPYVRLTGDGKAPYLGHFRSAIEKALNRAAGAAYRNLVRPAAPTAISHRVARARGPQGGSAGGPSILAYRFSAPWEKARCHIHRGHHANILSCRLQRREHSIYSLSVLSLD